MPWQITLVASCRRVVPSYNNEDSDTFHVWKITSEQSTCSHCCLQYYGDDKVKKKIQRKHYHCYENIFSKRNCSGKSLLLSSYQI